MYINVRSKAEIQNLQKSVDKKTGKLKNITLSDSEAAETTHGSYQKGFTAVELKAYLEGKGIGTIIHYPIPPHLSEAYGYLGYSKGSYPITEHYADTVLSIPMYNGMTEEEQIYVIEALNSFR